MNKQRIFAMRLRPVDEARLERLHQHYGIDRTSLIRVLLERDERRIAEPAQPNACATSTT